MWSVDKLSNKIYDMRDAYLMITKDPMAELPVSGNVIAIFGLLVRVDAVKCRKLLLDTKMFFYRLQRVQRLIIIMMNSD